MRNLIKIAFHIINYLSSREILKTSFYAFQNIEAKVKILNLLKILCGHFTEIVTMFLIGLRIGPKFWSRLCSSYLVVSFGT